MSVIKRPSSNLVHPARLSRASTTTTARAGVGVGAPDGADDGPGVSVWDGVRVGVNVGVRMGVAAGLGVKLGDGGKMAAGLARGLRAGTPQVMMAKAKARIATIVPIPCHIGSLRAFVSDSDVG